MISKIPVFFNDSGRETEEACGAEWHRRLESHCQFSSCRWILVSVTSSSDNSYQRFPSKGKGSGYFIVTFLREI